MNQIPPTSTHQESSISQKKQRIEFFDLAKGFCIFLVVVYHVSKFYGVELPGTSIIKSMRLPLYFFLSGCFFKTYGGFGDFMLRKCNKLLFPFLFWFVFSLGLDALLFFTLDVKLFSNYDLTLRSIISNSVYGPFPNAPIWFLLCLFWVNLIFYTIHLVISKWSVNQPIAIGLSTIVIGMMGVTLSHFGIRVPLYVDSALIAMPFFAFGYFFFRYTPLASKHKSDRFFPLVIIVFFVLLYFMAPNYSLGKIININFHTFLAVYLSGFIGTLSVIMLSKMIQKLPVVSFWGRYSIMILVTHGIVYRLISIFILTPLNRYVLMGPNALFIINLVLTLTFCTILIPFMLRFMPHVTAQKDIIKVGS